MKKLFWYEFSLLATIDLIYLLAWITQYNAHIDMRDIGISLAIANLFLGPLQLIPAFILAFKTRIRTNLKFLVYLLLAFATIFVFIINININLDHLIFITYFVYIQIFAWLLAHYFVFTLYDLSRLKITKQFS